jgi:hypothetical protein
LNPLGIALAVAAMYSTIAWWFTMNEPKTEHRFKHPFCMRTKVYKQALYALLQGM